MKNFKTTKYYLFKNLDQNDLVGAVEIDFMRIYDLK